MKLSLAFKLTLAVLLAFVVSRIYRKQRILVATFTRDTATSAEHQVAMAPNARASIVCTGTEEIIVERNEVSFFERNASQIPSNASCVGPKRPSCWYSFQGLDGPVWIQVLSSLPLYVSVFDRHRCISVTVYTPEANDSKLILETIYKVTYNVRLVQLNSTDLAQSAVRVIIHPIIVTPINDACDTALPISLGSTVVGSLEFLRGYPTDHSHFECLGIKQHGLWYHFQGTGDRVKIDARSLPDPHLSIYRGGCGSVAQPMQCVLSEMRVYHLLDTVVGRTYHIQLVQSHKNTGGSAYWSTTRFQMRIDKVPSIPSNEVCVAAIPMTIGSSVVGNLSFAVTDKNDLPSCSQVNRPPYRGATNRGLWYNFQGTGGRIQLKSCSKGYGKAHIWVFAGQCGSATLQCIAEAVDECTLQKFLLDTDMGTTYSVFVEAYYFKLVLESVPFILIPVNDACSGALDIPLGSSVTGDLSFAKADFGETVPGLWYNLQGTGARLWINACHGSAVPAIYVGAGRCMHSLKDWNNGGGGSICQTGEKLLLDTSLGATYKIHVTAHERWDWSGGTYNLTVNEVPVPKNDDCPGASHISIGSSVFGNPFYATSDWPWMDQRNGGPQCYGSDHPGLWYSFQGTGERVWLSTCSPESKLHSSITILTGSCKHLICRYASRDICGLEKFMLDTVVGTTYYLLVVSPSTLNTLATFQLSIQSIPPWLPNDICSGAAPITVGSPVIGNLTYAMTDEKEVPILFYKYHQFHASRPGLWYSFQGSGRPISINLTIPESMKTEVSIFMGKCGYASLINARPRGHVSFPLSSNFEMDTSGNTTYYMLVQSGSNMIQKLNTFELVLVDVTL